MNLKVGIDGRALEGNRAGTGRYVYELCRSLDSALPEAQFFVYSSKPVEPPVISPRWVYKVEPIKAVRRWKSILWLKLRAGQLATGDNLDVYWASSTFLPVLRSDVRVVSTVYDLAYLLVPATMKTVTYIAFKLFFRRDVCRASKILAISYGTAQRLQANMGIQVDGVVKPAVSDRFCQVEDEAIQIKLQNLGINSPYILAVGTLEPRKNLEQTIVDFLDLKQRGKFSGIQLILVGAKGWKTSRLRHVLMSAGPDIKALGFVDDEDLPCLYAGCAAFVFPSLYEGFGMPVLEARACGAKVYAYDLSEIREAGGDSVNYVQPGNSIMEEVAKKMTISSLGEATYLPKYERPTWEQGAEILAKALAGKD